MVMKNKNMLFGIGSVLTIRLMISGLAAMYTPSVYADRLCPGGVFNPALKNTHNPCESTGVGHGQPGVGNGQP